MSGPLSRFVDLRPQEGSLVLKSTVILAGLIAAHTMLETARDALFLGRLAPSRLTFVYALLAGLAMISAQANSAFVQRFGRRNALIFTLLGSAYGTVVLYLLPATPTVVFTLYVWSGLLGSIVVVQFWMLAGELFTVAQGKRLFGMLAAGGVLGAVLGATVSSLALRSIEVRHLLPLASTVFLLTATLATTIEVDPLPKRTAARRAPRFSIAQLFSGVAGFQRNPYLYRLAALVIVSTCAVLATDYMFKSVAARSMKPEELGPFFAGYYAVLNTIALITQLLVAGTLVRRTGVLTAFCVLPLLLLLGGASLLVVGGSFASVLLIKGADGALRHSLHRISSELLWMPLPDDAKADSKAFVDTVVVRGAQAAMAGALLLLATMGWDRPELLAAIVVASSGLWLFLAARLRTPYLDLFRKALHRDTPDAMQGMLNLNIESVAVVVEALSSRDPERSIAAIDLLEANNQQQVIPALILYHESPEVLIRALDVIASAHRKDWGPLAERLLEHEQAAVRTAALKALAKNGDLRPVERRLLDIDPAVRAQAAFWLARSEAGPPEVHPAVRQIIDMGRTAQKKARGSLLEAIAAAGDQRWTPLILELCALEEHDPEVIASMAKAMRTVADPRLIPPMIRRLRYRAGRETIRLAFVELGEPALEALSDALREPSTPRGVRRHIPRSLARFDDQRAADVLVDRLSVERNGLVRFKILRGLGQMAVETSVRFDSGRIETYLHQSLVEYLRLLSLCVPIREGVKAAEDVGAANSGALLLGLLDDKIAQALDRAFRFLHLLHPDEDLQSAAAAVDSADRRLRAQALEYLDALTLSAANSEIRTLLRLVADDLPDSDRIARAAAFVPDPPKGYHPALSRLLRDADDAIASIAAYHALMLRTAGLTNDVLTVSEERPTLSDLQRIVDHLSNSDEVPSVA